MSRILAWVSIFCCFLTSLECRPYWEKVDLQKMNASEGAHFLESVIEEIQSQYGLKLNLSDACRIVKANIDQLDVPLDVRGNLILIAESFAAYSIAEKEQLREVNSWKWGSKKKTKNASREELVLPDKLAAGFACAFAGALLCIVPGGQGAGLTLIGTGLALAIEGMSDGERPYFTNTEGS